ncbi:hypothetical protein GGI15_001606 [Coemansia interrupta]|uniref:Condensin complex subunit 2 n=1 Tax=Coemansia interrupta TaxID=1126814 RepID=A0A9W8HI41_9FUNG|nr:hypothetical protein GGI15_001606 [Coemansia interrupta]
MFSTPRHSSSGTGTEISSPQSAGVPATPRVNDDAAERRRRRKSAIERRRSNLVTPHRLTTKAPLFNQSPRVSSPSTFAVQLPRLTPEELNQRYEEWMKIAADNKINANNTWDFALIDYFYDMSLLRDGDSINFQKASCTLDGCVKIYASRVDSVATETGRLLSGLAEAPGKRGRKNGAGGDDGEDEDEEDGSGKQKSRRTARSANTLAKDFSSISVKKLDLEFSVDPLFKKTSADFDEGGARGLLLNHLAFDADGKIVFDASDSKTVIDSSESQMDGLAEEEDDDEVSDREQVRPRSAATTSGHKASLIDISTMDSLFGNIMQHLDTAEICPSLADFEFTRDTSLDFSLLKENFRDGDAISPMSDSAPSYSGDTIGDIDGDDRVGFGGDDADDGDDMGHFLNFDDVESGPVPLETASTLQATELREAQEQEMGEKGQDGMMAALHGGGQLTFAMAEDEDNLLSYFDTKLSKSWAGPSHWHLPISRAAIHKQQQQQQQGADNEPSSAEDPEAAKRKRAEKQLFFTDFLNGPDVSPESLFATPTRASMITMSKKAAMNQDHTLPEDVHFSSKNLFNLLLKPRLKFNPRRSRAQISAPAASGGADGAIGGALGGGSDSYGGFVVDGDDVGQVFGTMDDGRMDDMDDMRIGFDDVDDDFEDSMPVAVGAEAGGEEAKPDIPQLRLIKPLYVNYARRAKRVNVKKLKDNIWRELASGDRRKSTAASEMSVDNEDEVKVEGDQKFSQIVSSLKDVYPREKLEDLSISYCFICLLHLANERNLRIVGDQSLSDLTITQDRFD